MIIGEDILREFAESASNDLGRLLQGAAASMQAAVLARVAAQGHPDIRGSHVAAFASLDLGGTHISVMAARSAISRQAMGVIVRELEALGYLATERDPNDQRATIVQLTERGVSFCRLAIQISNEWNREVEALLGVDDAQRMRQQLKDVATLFGA